MSDSTANSAAAPLSTDQYLAMLDIVFALDQQQEEYIHLFDLLWTALFTQEGGQS